MPRGVDPYDHAKLQGHLWTPAIERPDAWWVVAPGSVQTASGAVSQLNDLTGNGRHMTQGTAGSRFTYSDTGGPRGQAIMTGTGKSMSASVASSTFTAGLTLISVWRKIGSATAFNAAPLTRGFGNKPGPVDYYDASRYGGNGTAAFDATTTADNLGTSSLFTVFNILSQVVTASPFVLNEYVNGVLRKNYTFSATYGDAGSAIYLATRADGGTTANMDFIEGYVFQSITTAGRQRVEGYLSWKHWPSGQRPLGGAHPFRDRPPLIGD